MNKFGWVLVSLLSLVGCAGQDDVDDNADTARMEAQKALAPAKTHLILLSGQSNMSRMIWSDEENQTGYLLGQMLVPTLERAFPNDQFIIVPVAYGGRPISSWVPNGNIYNELIRTANQRTAGKKIDTVTFIWRQGEADHDNDALAKAYEGNLRKLYTQLKGDFKNNEVNWVIGRLNDADIRMTPSWQYHDNWMLIRRDEVNVANSIARARWVDCDSFNDDGGNGVHGAPSDYLRQQKAFADAAIALIRANP
jgi:hypothetical protein